MIKEFVVPEVCLHTHCKDCVYIPERPLGLEVFYVTPAQYRLLEFLIQDLMDKEIGDRMHISPRTVKNHLTAIRKVVGKNRVGLSVLFVSGQIKIKGK
jgi:DNA-binding CsgD family transcriptional regulator